MFGTNLAYPIKDNIIRQFSVLYGVSLDSPIWTRNARALPPPYTHTHCVAMGNPLVSGRGLGERTLQTSNHGTTEPLLHCLHNQSNITVLTLQEGSIHCITTRGGLNQPGEGGV